MPSTFPPDTVGELSLVLLGSSPPVTYRVPSPLATQKFASKVHDQVSGLMLLDLSASLGISDHSLVPDSLIGFWDTTLLAQSQYQAGYVSSSHPLNIVMH